MFVERYPHRWHMLHALEYVWIGIILPVNIIKLEYPRKHQDHINRRQSNIIVNWSRTAMAEMAEVNLCSNPGCNQPGTSSRTLVLPMTWAHLPEHLTTFTTLTTTTFFGFMSNPSPSMVEWTLCIVVCLRILPLASSIWVKRIITEQIERRLPGLWTDARIIWSWHCLIFVKQFDSTERSISWILPTSFFWTSLKPWKTYDRSESPAEQQEQWSRLSICLFNYVAYRKE